MSIQKLSDIVERKFIESIPIPDFMDISVMSEDGYVPVTHSNKTVEYQIYKLITETGKFIECADTHIIMDHNGEEVFAMDCVPYKTKVRTVDGIEYVTELIVTDQYDHMYDISVDSEEHTFYSNGILSHNTTTFAADILHDIIFTEDYKVALSSYTNTNVLDFMERIQYVYEQLPWWLKPPCVVYNKFSIRFSNNSSVFGQVTQANFCRGKTVNRIILDELAFVDAKISEELMASLLPSISGSGENSTTRLNIISTPKGTIGAFYQIWSDAITNSNEFKPVEVKYEEIPGRTEEFERSMLKSMTRDKFDQEFRNMFISSSGTLVNSRLLEAIETEPPVADYGDFEIFVDSLSDRKIALALDPSEGIGEDDSAIQVFDIDTFEQVGEYANNMVNHSTLVTHIVRFIKYLYAHGAKEVYYGYESNGIGSGLGILFDNVNDPDFDKATMISDDARLNKGMTGMHTSGPSKKAACGQLKDMIEMNKITIRSQKLINQLKTFVKKGASFEAESGNKDDRVSACLVLTRMLHILRNYEDNVDDMVSEVSLDLSGDDGDWSDIFF